MKPIGYSNKTPGDETTDCVEVTKLTGPQSSIKAAADYLIEDIASLKKQLEAAEERLTALRAECTHHVFRDEGGFPYDHRWCVLCGSFRGSV